MPSPTFAPNVEVSIFRDRSSVNWATATPDETNVQAQQLPSWVAYNDEQASFLGGTDFFLRRFYLEPGALVLRPNEPPNTNVDFIRIDAPPYPCYQVIDVDNRYDSEGNFVLQYVLCDVQLSQSTPAP